MKCKNHSSIPAIQKYSKNKTFHFKEVKTGEIEKEILRLDKTKASQKSNIPAGIFKENSHTFAEFLRTSINSAIKPSILSSSLKLADVTPVHKMGRKDTKETF